MKVITLIFLTLFLLLSPANPLFGSQQAALDVSLGFRIPQEAVITFSGLAIMTAGLACTYTGIKNILQNNTIQSDLENGLLQNSVTEKTNVRNKYMIAGGFTACICGLTTAYINATYHH